MVRYCKGLVFVTEQKEGVTGCKKIFVGVLSEWLWHGKVWKRYGMLLYGLSSFCNV